MPEIDLKTVRRSKNKKGNKDYLEARSGLLCGVGMVYCMVGSRRFPVLVVRLFVFVASIDAAHYSPLNDKAWKGKASF